MSRMTDRHTDRVTDTPGGLSCVFIAHSREAMATPPRTAARSQHAMHIHTLRGGYRDEQQQQRQHRAQAASHVWAAPGETQRRVRRRRSRGSRHGTALGHCARSGVVAVRAARRAGTCGCRSLPLTRPTLRRHWICTCQGNGLPRATAHSLHCHLQRARDKRGRGHGGDWAGLSGAEPCEEGGSALYSQWMEAHSIASECPASCAWG